MGETSDEGTAYGRLAAMACDAGKPVGRSFGDIEFYRERLAAWREREAKLPDRCEGSFWRRKPRDGEMVTISARAS